MAEIEHQYEYKSKWWHVLFAGGFFILVGAYTIALASPQNSPVLFWTFLVLSLAGIAVAGAMAVERLFFRRRIAFTPTSLVLPKPGSFSREEAIDYQAITGLKVLNPGGRGLGYLFLTYEGGRRTISESSLPSTAAFQEICALLTARVGASE
jgi:hypothetical protein